MTKVYLEPKEIELLEKAATNLRDKLLVRLLGRLGCRITEALGIKTGDINFIEGTVTIQDLKTRLMLTCPLCNARLGKSYTFCQVCGGKVDTLVKQEKEHRRVRTLPLDRESLQMLKEYISRGGPVLRGDKRMIFGINRHRAWQIVVECSRRAGLGELVNPETGRVHNVSPHKLRDAFAVMAVKHNDSGDGLRLLQQHLGHSSFDTTARYRKIGGTEHREWYNKLWDNHPNNEGNK